MEEKIHKILLDNFKKGDWQTARKQLLDLFIVNNIALIDYIETDAEIAIPIDEMFNDDGTHITKKKYGHILLKHLVKELREHYC